MNEFPFLIAVGRSSVDTTDTEARLAARLLARDLPPLAIRVDCAASDCAGLATAARGAAEQRGLPDATQVLLLAHEQMVFAPGSLDRLTEALERGANTAAASGSNRPPVTPPPDYLTLRGMERYAARAALFPDAPTHPLEVQPLALLTTAGALRSDRWTMRAVRVPGAWLHDFSNYRGGRREEIVPLVPENARRVLDVGGGEGGFLTALKAARPTCETHLAEVSPEACGIAAGAVDTVWQGDFLSLPLPTDFDCITFLDVLEHATHPVAWLTRARELLAPDGVVVLSIPNVGHWSVVADLLEGRWDYAPAGIHCITHLRFFTRTGVLALLRDAGFTPVCVEAQRIDPPHWFDIPAMGQALAIDTDSLATYAFLAVARISR